MEGKQRLLQLLAFSTGPAIDVVQHYFEVKIIQQYRDFEDYLNDPQNKHKLFHEHCPKIPCCACIPISIAAHSKRGCLGNLQFAKLYDENGTVIAGHEKTMRGQISQHCICKVSAQKSVKVIDIDITLLNAIMQHCCPLHITSKISRWMKDIKEVRNTFSRWPEGKLDQDLFDQTWIKLETATLECAGDIGHACVKIFKIAIDQITTCSVAGLGESILENTKHLSEVREDLNGVIPIVKSILSKQNAITDKISTHSKDLTEVKTGVAGVNTDVAAIKTDVAGVNTAVAGVDTKIGDVKHMLSDLKFMVGIILKQGKTPGVNDKAEKKRRLSLDVDASSSTWNEERTTLNLADTVQTVKHDYDNNEGFQLEKVVNKCIHLELSASPELFQSSQKLRKAIKSLILQFVKAGELEENVPATVYINITVKSELTTEEKNVVYTVFSENDTLDGSDYDKKLQIEQKRRLYGKTPTIEPDQQIASTSASEILYSRYKVKSITGVAVKREIHKDVIERISVHLENIKFNLQIKGLPHRISNSSDTEQYMNIEESSDCSVIWTWHYTQKKHSWDFVPIVDTINSKISHLRDWFRVEYAKIDIFGRLALQTTTAGHTFSSLSSLEMAVKSFLGKFIEVCDLKKYLEEEQWIKLDLTSQLNEDQVVDVNLENMRDEIEKSVDTILTCDDCKKDMICLMCKTKKILIEELNDKLQEQRNTMMRLQKRKTTLAEWKGGFDENVCSNDDEKEDMDFDDSVLKKRKTISEISTDKEYVKEEQECFVIDKEKALQKLGEIPLIDMKIREGQCEKKLMSSTYVYLMSDCLISDLRRQRKQRSAIVEALAEIVTTNRNKIVTSEDKRYLKDLDFLNVNLESLSNKCQQCKSQCSDLMTYVCTKCKRIFCKDCMRGHTEEFPDHVYVFRDNISSGLEYHGEILIDYGKFVMFELSGARVIDMKSVKGMVVVIMFMVDYCCLQAYSAVKEKQSGLQNQLKIELDKEKSQIAIIDENMVAVTAPCKSSIHIVNLITNKITTINCTTDMTGAIAFIESRLYVACSENIWTMNLQGENLVSISLPDIQFLHPTGQNKMYCISRNPLKNISYLDMTNMEEHQLSKFPFHPVRLTTDDFGNIYFISHNVVLKAAHNGADYKVILSQDCFSWTPKLLCFDISNNLLLVQIYYNLVSIYRTG